MGAVNEKIQGKNPLLLAILLSALITLLTQYLIYQEYVISKNNEQEELELETFAVKERLQTALQYNKSATKTLAFIVKNYGIPEKFDSIAKNLINANKHIDAIQLVPNGVIKYVYPLKNNESVIGYNILEDPKTKIEAYKAIDKKELYFAGPINLKQGGVAVVGRLPVFINDKFWGFSCVLVKLATIKKIIEVDSLKNKKFLYEFSKINVNTNKEEFFLGSGLVKNENTSVVYIEEGNWHVYVQLLNGLNKGSFILFSLAGLIFSLICGYFTWHIVKQPQLLKKLVLEKTEQIINNENNFKTTLERISDSIVAFDKEWKYTYLNNAALPHHPLGKEGTLGKVLWEVHPELVGTVFWEKYHEAMNTNRVTEIEDYYKPMNLWFSVTCYPSKDGLTVFYRDITAFKLASIEAQNQKNLSESIINSLPGIFYLYSETGKFIKWNKNVEHITGYTTEEISKLKPIDFFDYDQKDIIKSKIEDAFIKGSADVETNLLTKNKNKIPFYLNGTLININNHNYLIGIGIDITERKLAELEKEKTTIDLIQRNKNMEQFSYIISHNLRAPLANILGFIEIMNYDEIKENELQTILTGIATAANKLDEVVKDLNNILLIKNLAIEKKEDVYFKNLIKNISLSIKNIIQKNDVKIITDFTEVEKIHSIKPFLYSIFYNLILNSIKYRRPGIAAEINIKSVRKANDVQLIFKDNGLGIDLKMHGDNLFGLYKRFHFHTEGKGLGLFMIKSQLESMGGKISVTSEVNKGTEFVIDFTDYYNTHA